MTSASRQGRISGILKASSLMGAASLVAIVCGSLKNKAAAVILGPGGFGYLALLQSMLGLGATIAAVGLGSSGVQCVAAAAASASQDEAAHARRALYGASFLFGLAGTAAMAAFSAPLARAFLGSEAHAADAAWISLGVWATVYAGAQLSLLNGLRMLPSLARANAYGAVGAMVGTIGSLLVWKENGIVAASLSMPLATLLSATWLSRGARVPDAAFDWEKTFAAFKKLISLGVVFMTTAMLVMGSQFLARVIISRRLGLAATGHFQAAWTISMLYLGFILNAMMADYYPRVSASAADHPETVILANEQAEVALLMAAPVIMAMIPLCPFVIHLLYTPAFSEAVAILRWQLLGDVFKIVSWSLSIILIGGAYGRYFLVTEVVFHILYIALLWFGLPIWGLEVAGVAFFAAYAVYFLAVWVCVRRLVGFRWDASVVRRFFLVLGGVLAVLTLSRMGAGPAWGLSLAAIMGVYSVRQLLAGHLDRIPYLSRLGLGDGARLHE